MKNNEISFIEHYFQEALYRITYNNKIYYYFDKEEDMRTTERLVKSCQYESKIKELEETYKIVQNKMIEMIGRENNYDDDDLESIGKRAYWAKRNLEGFKKSFREPIFIKIDSGLPDFKTLLPKRINI
jgi:hypothetical protein